jgi:hypothetical protein
MVLNANATARATVITRRIGFSFSPGVGLIRPAPISRPEYPRTARVLRQYGEFVKPRRRPPLASLAPHQPRPARDAAPALECGGVVRYQGRVQASARAAERDPACGVRAAHHVQGLDVLGRRRRRWWRTPRTRAGCLPDSGNCWYLRAQSTDARNSTALLA